MMSPTAEGMLASSVWVYGISGLLVLLVASTGARFRPDDWYAQLRKPAGLPPNWVFPVVWFALYGLMALAAARIWLTPPDALRTWGLMAYGAQLLLNAAWSWLFFGLHRSAWALIDLMLLIGVVLAAIWLFFSVDVIAGQLLLPYLFWLVIALYLNASIIWLNRSSLAFQR